MKPFDIHQGVAAPLLQDNIDTDAIIPSREMKLVSKRGLSRGLFANWRYLQGGGIDPEFILNRPGFEATSILLSLSNFGCGSSREHAVWALDEYGICTIVAVSFGAIFRKNCTSNGILTAELPSEQIYQISEWVNADPERHQISVNLTTRELTWCNRAVEFSVPDHDRSKLLSGLDPIGEALTYMSRIAGFEQRHWDKNPWARLGKHKT